MVKFGVDVEDADVVLHVHLVAHVGRIEDEIELEGEGFGPVLVLGADKVFRAELESVLFLVGRVRDGSHFGAEGVCEHDGEVAEAADADDCDLLARAGAGADEGRVDG